MDLETQYSNQADNLLPRGNLWEGMATIKAILRVAARAFARVHARFEDLKRESDPRTAVETLEDHERVLGLPDECTLIGTTITERQLNCHRKHARTAHRTKADFVALALEIGFTVSAAYASNVLTITVPNAATNGYFHNTFTTASTVDEFLEEVATLDVECAIRRAAPAHIEVIFNYT